MMASMTIHANAILDILAKTAKQVSESHELVAIYVSMVATKMP